MNSAELHTILSATFAEAERIIQAETLSSKGIIFHTYYDTLHATRNNKELYYCVRNGFASDAIEVRGRDFWDCVAEFIHRVNFAQRQANLQLGPPTIDNSLTP